MTIRILVSIAGADVCFRPGEIAVVERRQAEAWIASGIAEAFAEEEEPHMEASETPKVKKAKR